MRSTSAGSAALRSPRYGEGRVPTYSVGHTVIAAGRSASCIHDPSVGLPGSETGLHRDVVDEEQEPRHAVGPHRLELGEQRGPVVIGLVVDVQSGRDREAEPHAEPGGVGGDLRGTRELRVVVRRSPFRGCFASSFGAYTYAFMPRVARNEITSRRASCAQGVP